MFPAAFAFACISQIAVAGSDCPADFAPPEGFLDFNDVVGFLTAFGAGDPSADFVAPIGVFDFNDVVAFLSAFSAGCP